MSISAIKALSPPVLVALLVVLMSCGGDAVGAPDVHLGGLTPKDTTGIVRVGALVITALPGHATLFPTQAATLYVGPVDGSQPLASDRVNWSSSNPSVASITMTSGNSAATITGYSPGTAIISATLGRGVGTYTMQVLPDSSGNGSRIVVESFSMLEFKYPGENTWHYAPQIRIQNATGVGDGVVTSVSFDIPKISRAPSYRPYVTSGNNGPVDLFHIVNGDFQLTIEQNGARASGADAIAILTVYDGTGFGRSIRVTGAVVAGLPP